MESSADFHRPHRTSSMNSSSSTTVNTTAASELFICFTSRFSSSSSMKLSSKSVPSPARARDSAPPPAQISLSSSLSRRLRSNGSLKGGQASPMFHSGSKKRGGSGGGYDNPEPSSPKVTCIGQVRVRTKKQGKKFRTRSKRREASFRKLEISRSGHHSFPPQQSLNGNPECLPYRTQRWVHFPVTICDSLRTLGADWNCFLPCRSSCMTSREEKSVAMAARSNDGRADDGRSCGEVVDRWLMSVHEGEDLVGGEEIVEETMERIGNRRRHVFEGLEFNEEEIRRARKEGEEEEGRVRICIPPKNALLLMRCRSDPVKMAVLAKRFCGSPVQKDEDQDCQEGDGNEKMAEVEIEEIDDSKEEVSEGCPVKKAVMAKRFSGSPVQEDEDEDCQEGNSNEKMAEVEIEEIDDSKEEVNEGCQINLEVSQELRTAEAGSCSMAGEQEDGEDEEGQENHEETIHMLPEESENKPENTEEEESTMTSIDAENEGSTGEEEEEEEEEDRGAKTELLSADNGGIEFDHQLVSTPPPKSESVMEEAEEGDVETWPETEGRAATHNMAREGRSEPEKLESEDSDLALGSKARDSIDRETAGLPDCLLLMMREPKLSMEVSKETWVCSTDFIRWLPERHVKKSAAGGDDPKKRAHLNPKRSGSALAGQQACMLQQPRRSSCSFPSQAAAAASGAAGRAESGATMVEQKLSNTAAKPGEPLILTRCKSEPMRTAMPDGSCFWKNRKLEPHRQSADMMRVKAAGMGF
ncbi:hypothetical protein SAY87_004144 [Trapa incisa]|uniref:Chloroplast protein HCF243 n=1 Tax=Trapa incisa TaxID=236973 RepID=A0AAN7PJT6_9MYRT|nr:hypothetical protein SAY87_004144 [Trapa incisa]